MSLLPQSPAVESKNLLLRQQQLQLSGPCKSTRRGNAQSRSSWAKRSLRVRNFIPSASEGPHTTCIGHTSCSA